MILSVDIGSKHLAVCVVGRRDHGPGIEAWDVCAIPDPQGAAEVYGALKDMWARAQALGARRAVIERQPPRSNLMQRIQHYCELLSAAHDMEVLLVHPRSKLAFAATQPYYSPPQSEAYRDRKKAAVLTAAAFLDTGDEAATEEARATFSGAKKKDDLADALLQALAFL